MILRHNYLNLSNNKIHFIYNLIIDKHSLNDGSEIHQFNYCKDKHTLIKDDLIKYLCLSNRQANWLYHNYNNNPNQNIKEELINRDNKINNLKYYERLVSIIKTKLMKSGFSLLCVLFLVFLYLTVLVLRKSITFRTEFMVNSIALFSSISSAGFILMYFYIKPILKLIDDIKTIIFKGFNIDPKKYKMKIKINSTTRYDNDDLIGLILFVNISNPRNKIIYPILGYDLLFGYENINIKKRSILELLNDKCRCVVLFFKHLFQNTMECLKNNKMFITNQYFRI